MNHKYLDDVAKYLYEKDMRSDIEGTQNLVTYVVGFFIDDTLLSQLPPPKGAGSISPPVALTH